MLPGRIRLALGVAVLALVADAARADDLRDALVTAYNSNPTLQAARANQRAVDAAVPIARAQGLPSLSGSATYTENVRQNISTPYGPDRSLAASTSLTVPVFSGGSVRNSLRAAEIRVDAGQLDLRSSESQVFSQTVAAYMDVILNQAIVGLNRSNVNVLTINLQATHDRFQIGDLTQTDVAQSQSRLAVAQSQTRSAEANLIQAKENYIKIVGKPPVDLQTPPALPGLPKSVDEAVQIALDENPDLIAAHERTKAAKYDTAAAGASRWPTISLFGGGSYTDYLDSYGSRDIPAATLQQRYPSAQVGVRASVPIFQGGLPAAQKRQAQARENSTQETEIQTEREIIAGVRAAYAQWQAAGDVIVSSQTAVDSARLSLEGVRAENTVGNRSILDILNAEQELVNAQVDLVTAERNAYVAGFNLLSAMGRAEARDLALDGGALYDPNVNYKRVRHDIWDWAQDPAPTPQSTRTVNVPAQDATIPPGSTPTVDTPAGDATLPAN